MLYNWRELITSAYFNLYLLYLLFIYFQNEFEATTFNMYIMTKEECIAPFVNKESATCKAGLRLESAHTELLPCPLNTSWHNLQTKGAKPSIVFN